MADQLADQLGFIVESATGQPGFIIRGQKSAVSRIHGDSNGFYSVIELASGAKLWIFMTKGSEPEGHPTMSTENWRDFAKCEYDVVLVEEGDIMCVIHSSMPCDYFLMSNVSLMPPGTFHAVLTIRDSVSTGHMFYVPCQLVKTFYTMVQIHVDGLRISNSDYRGAQLGLFRLVAYYATVLEEAGLAPDEALPKPWTQEEDNLYAQLQSRSKRSDDPYKNLMVPPLEDLAALVCIVLNSERLTPQHSDGEPLNPYPAGYKHDRSLGKKYAQLVLNRVIRRISHVETFYNELEVYRKNVCDDSVVHQNRHQRDLPEIGEPIDETRFAISEDPYDPEGFVSTFLHDNEHELRTRGHGPWEGKRPEPPIRKGKRRRYRNRVDSEEEEDVEVVGAVGAEELVEVEAEAEWSEGEYIPSWVDLNEEV